VIKPIVGEITTAISASIVDVTALVSQPAEIIMATVDGTAQITIAELATLVADLIVVRFLLTRVSLTLTNIYRSACLRCPWCCPERCG
jgi:hypothetical protein